MQNYLTLLYLVLGGAAGGIVRSVVNGAPTEYTITLPISGRIIQIGSLGDVVIGATAAIVGYTFFNVLGPTVVENTSPDVIRILGFGIASGYAGARILNAMLEKFPEQKLDMLAAKQEAMRLFDGKKYHIAVRRFRDLLTQSPNDPQAKFNLALALSYTGPEGEREALELLQDVVRAKPTDSEAWYNIACIRAISKWREFSEDDVLGALEKAVELDPSWRDYATRDEDFVSYRQSARFQRTTGEASRE